MSMRWGIRIEDRSLDDYWTKCNSFGEQWSLRRSAVLSYFVRIVRKL